MCTSSHIYWLYFISPAQVTCNIILSFLSLMKWHIHIFRNWLYFVRITSCLLFLCRYILALLMLALTILCAQIHCILPLWYVMYYETLTYNLFSFVISYFPLFSPLGFFVTLQFISVLYIFNNKLYFCDGFVIK